MANRELVKQEVDQLRDDQLERVIEFIAFLRFQEQSRQGGWQPLLDSLSLFSDDFMAIRNQPDLNLRESLA